MSITDKEIREIALPLTGFIVTDEEAALAQRKLLSLGHHEFRQACRALAQYSFKNESPTNKIKVLLDNLSSKQVDVVLRRMLDVATPLVLAGIN